jgi:3-oxoacyl-[acyl-carrier protein] reductase
MSEFANKKVLITGAAGVFGNWIAQAFAKEGARLFLTDFRLDALREQVKELSPQSENPIVHQDDSTDDASLSKLVVDVREHWGAPDIFIDSAGIYPFASILDTTNELWDEIFDVNLRAPFILTRDIAKLMLAEKVEGNIIHIGSGAARSLRPNGIPYCVSKASLERLAKGFAVELAPHGIRVNVVEPGFSPGSAITEFPEGYVDQVIAGIPIGRTSGPEDTPSAVLFLCSEKAGFITGACLSVDGGNSLGKRKSK